MMDRRAFITMVGGGILAGPLVSEAQPGTLYRIGFLFYGAPGPSAEVDAFRQGLRELGYQEGLNVAIEYRFASGQVERLPELATELARLKVDVIVTTNTPSAMAAKQATSTIPIVFAVVADAVGAGLISNFARRSNVLMLKQIQESAPTLRLTVHPLEVRAPGEFEGAFAAMTRDRDHALFVQAGVLTLEHRNLAALVDFATKSRIPAMWGHRQFVEGGGLMSYAVNFYDQLDRAAFYVDKILKGAKPADLPVEQPTKFELVINLKTAKTLGLTIPQSILTRADEVIR